MIGSERWAEGVRVAVGGLGSEVERRVDQHVRLPATRRRVGRPKSSEPPAGILASLIPAYGSLDSGPPAQVAHPRGRPRPLPQRVLQPAGEGGDEGGRVGEFSAFGEQGHAVEQLGGVNQAGVVGCGVVGGASRPVIRGWVGLSSRIRLVLGGSWPMARNIFSRVGDMSPASPTRQAAGVVSRWDSRTCLTSWSRVVASQLTRPSRSDWSRRRRRRRPGRPRRGRWRSAVCRRTRARRRSTPRRPGR